MWTQYRKTFWPMQALMLAVAIGVYLGFDHLIGRAVVFWVVMQVSAVIGAVWAVRLKTAFNRRSTALPLERRV